MHEIPLVLFTLFGQAAAGMIVLLAIQNWVVSSDSDMLKRVSAVAFIVMVVGMFFASFHLGKPFRALNVLFGIGRSPMTNEIMCFSATAGLLFVYVLLNFFDKSSVMLRKLLLLLTAVMSLIFVASIVGAYYIDTIHTWATCYTPLQMFATMLILGGVAVSALGLLPLGVMSALIGTLINVTMKAGYVSFLSAQAPELTAEQIPWWTTQSLCAVLGLSLLFFAKNCPQKARMLCISALVLVIIGELAGRIAFYNMWSIPM